jgi:pyruvate kinase
VHPILAPLVGSTEQMLELMERELLRRALLKQGDNVVAVAGSPIGEVASTNLMKLYRLR